MAIDKKFTDFNQKMKAMKEEALSDIIADTTMSKVEKLEFISQNNLMETESSWCDPFQDKYLDDYINKVIETPEFKEKWGKYNLTNSRNYVTTDDYFVNRDYQRHEVIDLADLAIDVSESNPSDKITIYTNRSTKDSCQITPQEFVDTIYDWVIKNNTIAFELDW